MKSVSFSRCVVGLVFISILFSASELKAQYNTAIGLRVGGTTGLDAKFFTKPSKAVEGIVGWFGNGSSLTVLFEKYSPIENATGLYIYYGGGPHLAFYNGDPARYSYFGRDVSYHRNNNLGIGINGIVGFEYRMPGDVPIAFSVDLKPFIELGTSGYVAFAPDPSIGVKFIIR
jgi:hypothetical protein